MNKKEIVQERVRSDWGRVNEIVLSCFKILRCQHVMFPLFVAYWLRALGKTKLAIVFLILSLIAVVLFLLVAGLRNRAFESSNLTFGHNLHGKKFTCNEQDCNFNSWTYWPRYYPLITSMWTSSWKKLGHLFSHKKNIYLEIRDTYHWGPSQLTIPLGWLSRLHFEEFPDRRSLHQDC